MVKQEDIAKMLNISRTTVARALNGSGSISPSTKEKILNLCEELGYSRNPISTSLALKKKRNIYAFIVKTRNPNYSKEIKQGFKRAQKEFEFYKYHLNIIETDIDRPEEQLELLNNILKTKDVEGIIITPLLKDEIKNTKKNNPKVTFIALDLPLDNFTYSVCSNYFKSGRITADILLNVLNEGEKILLIDTDDDRISSKLSFNGFLSKIKESSKCEVIGPIYQKDLKSNIELCLDENLTDDIKAIYSSRFLVNIVKSLCKRKKYNIKVIDNGTSDITKELIKNNRIVATVAQKYSELGYLATKYMFEYLYKDIKPLKINNELDSLILFKENFMP